MADVRVGQTAPEATTDALEVPLRLGQDAVEALTDARAIELRIGQIAVEVIRTLGCGSTPSPLPTAQARLIRRVRRTPHLSAEQVRQFFTLFQLDLQTGTGLREGQGSDPLVCLRWSDNGGHTWSSEHFVAAGKIGQYSRRAIWRRMGVGRDRVYEVSVSDPVAWRLLDAYLQVTVGSS